MYKIQEKENRKVKKEINRISFKLIKKLTEFPLTDGKNLLKIFDLLNSGLSINF